MFSLAIWWLRYSHGMWDREAPQRYQTCVPVGVVRTEKVFESTRSQKEIKAGFRRQRWDKPAKVTGKESLGRENRKEENEDGREQRQDKQQMQG